MAATYFPMAVVFYPRRQFLSRVTPVAITRLVQKRFARKPMAQAAIGGLTSPCGTPLNFLAALVLLAGFFTAMNWLLVSLRPGGRAAEALSVFDLRTLLYRALPRVVTNRLVHRHGLRTPFLPRANAAGRNLFSQALGTNPA